MTTESAVVRLDKVSKAYTNPETGGAITALDGISFVLPKKSFLFITGASGAGKSTLIRMLYAELAPSSGEIAVCGRNLSRIDAASLPLLRRQIGVIHQGFHLIPRKTAAENVALPLLVKGVGMKKANEKAEEMLAMVGMLPRRKHPVVALADGEKQRVALARALVIDPLLVVADEPTGNLDPRLSDEVFEIFDGMLSKGCAVIVATHDLKRVENSKRAVIYLEKGGIKASRGDIEARVS